MNLTIAGFNPRPGELAADFFDFDDELGDFAGDIIRKALRKKLIAKFPEKSNAEITDLVNLSLLYQSYAKSGSPKAVAEMARYWNVAPTAYGYSIDGLSGPLAAGYTRDLITGKRPWPGMPGAPKAPKAAPPKLHYMESTYQGVSATAPVTTKAALMHVIRTEKRKRDAKRERAKREASCPCKAREHAAKLQPLQFPPTIEAKLKQILGQLKYAELQRIATSEHRGMLTESQFRDKVLRLSAVCAALPESVRGDVIRVIMSRS